MSSAWSHGKFAGQTVAASGFDGRVLAALQMERETPRSPSRSWSASHPRQGAQLWTCRECGYKRNLHEYSNCSICNRAWSWKKQALQDKRASLVLANSFQPLAGAEQAASQPPWKHRSKGRGSGQWQEGRSKGTWRKEASTPEQLAEQDDDMGASDGKSIDLEDLRRLITSTSSTLGDSAPEVQALQERFEQEETKRQQRVPKHIQLQKLERRLKVLEQKLQKNDELVGKAEVHLQEASDSLEAVKAKGRGLLEQQLQWEADKQVIIAGLQGNKHGLAEGGQQQQQQAFLDSLGLDFQQASAMPQCQGLLKQLADLANQVRSAMASSPTEDKAEKQEVSIQQKQEGGNTTPIAGAIQSPGAGKGRPSCSRSPRRSCKGSEDKGALVPKSTATELGMEGEQAVAFAAAAAVEAARLAASKDDEFGDIP